MVHAHEALALFDCLCLCCLACVSHTHSLGRGQCVSSTQSCALNRGCRPSKQCNNQYVCSFSPPSHLPGDDRLLPPKPGHLDRRQTSSASPPGARAEASWCTHAFLTDSCWRQSTSGPWPLVEGAAEFMSNYRFSLC